jgi:hypothetical protein
LEGDLKFIRDDGGEGSLSQSWWPIEQNVIKSFAAGASRLDSDSEILFNFALSDKLLQALGTEL